MKETGIASSSMHLFQSPCQVLFRRIEDLFKSTIDLTCLFSLSDLGLDLLRFATELLLKSQNIKCVPSCLRCCRVLTLSLQYCLVLDDDFTSLDDSVWNHEVQLNGYGLVHERVKPREPWAYFYVLSQHWILCLDYR